MEDRNKTQLTHDVTQATLLWLDLHGFKPVETEVSVDRAWIADLAGVIVPTQTELTDLKLIPRKPSWNERKFPTWNARTTAWRKAYKAIDRVLTCLVEVKTSRGDFRGDPKWTRTLPTDLAYLAVPKGLITKEEWPAGWGILEFNEESGVLRCLRQPTPVTTTIEKQHGIILEIAIRRDHRTRYALLREQQKEERLERGEQKTLRRVSNLARALLDIIEGNRGSVEEVLKAERIKLPEYLLERIQPLHGINPQVVRTKVRRGGFMKFTTIKSGDLFYIGKRVCRKASPTTFIYLDETVMGEISFDKELDAKIVTLAEHDAEEKAQEETATVWRERLLAAWEKYGTGTPLPESTVNQLAAEFAKPLPIPVPSIILNQTQPSLSSIT